MGTGPKHGADMLSYLDPSNQCSRLSDRLSIFPTQQKMFSDVELIILYFVKMRILDQVSLDI